jgi:hypothetical protein
MAAHKHAALMLLYAQDAAETDRPWELWQQSDESGRWVDARNNYHMCWIDEYEYRRKPQPLECWVLVNSDGFMGCAWPSRDEIEQPAGDGCRIVHFREVTEPCA